MICLYLDLLLKTPLSGKRPEFTLRTRVARCYPKGVGFLFDFVADPPSIFLWGNRKQKTR